MSLVVDEHRQYLSDEVRVNAFRLAIREVVRPGDVVVDLGSGTGVLGLMACQAGAGRVYSIESTGIIELARTICRINEFQDRVQYIKGLSTRVELPEKADVVVCDQIGRFGFEAGVVQYLADARTRLLKPDGRLIPARIEMMVAPVESAQIRSQVEFWSSSPADINFSPARKWAANTGYPVHLQAADLLGEPAKLATLDLHTHNAAPFSEEMVLPIARPGLLDGIGGWFSAQLAPSVQMTNSPLAAARIGRQNVFLPIEGVGSSAPLSVRAGDELRIRLGVMPADVMLNWTGTLFRQGKTIASFSHSTLRGMLLCREDLLRTHPEFVPRLDPWGQARLTVLMLCDGKLKLQEIEQEVYRRHPDLLPSLAAAATFVAEVVTRYTLEASA